VHRVSISSEHGDPSLALIGQVRTATSLESMNTRPLQLRDILWKKYKPLVRKSRTGDWTFEV